LIVLISSSKGLCGSFNNNIIKFFQEKSKIEDYNQLDIISIGIYAYKFLINYSKDINHPIKIIEKFDHLSTNNINIISRNIKDIVIDKQYYQALFYYNYPKSFFKQIPHKIDILNNNRKNHKNIKYHDYILEDNYNKIINKIENNLLSSQIQDILVDSLIAEQAARFISMDNANNSATNILKQIKLEYHKLRQYKITKEITELATNS
jgi:F-type H+-transporting ATPase subunit gamma